MHGATVPLARSPLNASFQQMGDDEFAREARDYNRLWTQEGRFPQIAFPIPGPFRRFGPQMFICTSWSLIGKTLMQEGTVDEHDPRSLQVLVPQGTTHMLAQFLMIAWNGALSRLLIRGGIPYQYPHLTRLTNDFLSFVMPAGEKHHTIRGLYAAPADAEHIRSRNYERFAGLPLEERAALRGSGSVEEFTRQVMRADPPVGFVMRWLPRTFTFATPVPGRKLVLPQGSFVLFVPRLLQSDQLDDHCGDYLLTFGYGRDMVCPGRQLVLLTITICLREIISRFDLTLHGQPRTAENAFFRRILSSPGEVAVLDRVAQGPATAQA